MRKYLLYTAVAIGSAAVGFAGIKPSASKTSLNPATRAPEGPRREGNREGSREIAEKALREYYGTTAVAHITSEYDANGVKCFAATVDRGGMIAYADVTASGDLISMG